MVNKGHLKINEQKYASSKFIHETQTQDHALFFQIKVHKHITVEFIVSKHK